MTPGLDRRPVWRKDHDPYLHGNPISSSADCSRPVHSVSQPPFPQSQPSQPPPQRATTLLNATREYLPLPKYELPLTMMKAPRRKCVPQQLKRAREKDQAVKRVDASRENTYPMWETADRERIGDKQVASFQMSLFRQDSNSDVGLCAHRSKTTGNLVQPSPLQHAVLPELGIDGFVVPMLIY